MAIDILNLSSREIYVLSGIVFLVLAIVILKIIEKRLKKVIDLKENDRNLFYENKLKKMKVSSNPEDSLNAIDEIARDFFNEAFRLSYNLEYSELTDEFTKRKNKDSADFCSLMINLNYSGKKIEEEKIILLTQKLERIISKNKIQQEKSHQKNLKGRKTLKK